MASALFATSQANAQIAIAASAGSHGVGGQIAFGIMPRLSVRGTVGTIPVSPTFTVSDGNNSIEYEAELPTAIFAAGADFNLTSAIRLFGGLLIGADEVSATGPYSGTVTYGNQTYTGNGTVTASVVTSSVAPYAGIGFGRTVGSGIGLFLDLGGALLGESTVSITATGPIGQANASDIEAERRKIQEKVDKYAKVYPMLSIGLRVGL